MQTANIMNSNGAKITKATDLWRTEDELQTNHDVIEMDADMFEKIKKAHGIN